MEEISKKDKEFASELSAKGEKLKELNIEARTILSFKVDTAIIENAVPPELNLSPFDSGPSKGANLLVIYSDRLLVQTIDKDTILENNSNQLVVCAIPVQHSTTNVRGVAVVYGLSASPNGAPGPYGVFYPAKSNFQRLISTKGESGEVKEGWEFEGENGERLGLELSFTRGMPTRSNSVTHAYSGKDPDFYRTYYADQGVFVQFSSPSNIDTTIGFNFIIEVPDINITSEDCELISIFSQPWVVRHVSVPNDVAFK